MCKCWDKYLLSADYRRQVNTQERLILFALVYLHLWKINNNSGALAREARLRSTMGSKSTHPRKFGNHVTVHRPQPARPSAPQENQCSISHFLASLVAQEDWYCTHIVHQCCDQLTVVKTGYPLTSITWTYRGLRCRPIEVESSIFLKSSADKLLVFKWSQAQV